MAHVVSGDDLLMLARLRSGTTGQQTLTTENWLLILNQAIRCTWPFLAGRKGFARTSGLVTATPGTELVALPAAVFALHGVYRPTSGTSGARKPATALGEDYYLDTNGDAESGPAALPGFYWRISNDLVLRPVPAAAESILLTYSAMPVALAALTDEIDLGDGTALDAVIERAASFASQDPERQGVHAGRAEKYCKRADVVLTGRDTNIIDATRHRGRR